jgi:hypothetical protein
MGAPRAIYLDFIQAVIKCLKNVKFFILGQAPTIVESFKLSQFDIVQTEDVHRAASLEMCSASLTDSEGRVIFVNVSEDGS